MRSYSRYAQLPSKRKPALDSSHITRYKLDNVYFALLFSIYDRILQQHFSKNCNLYHLLSQNNQFENLVPSRENSLLTIDKFKSKIK